MLETGSFWVLQELFVEPSVAGTEVECSAELKVASELVERREGRCKVVVEISGSLIEGHRQVANLRFVNISNVELKKRVTSRTLLKRLEKKKLEELLSLLPIYALKAGISITRVEHEL